MAIDEKHSDYKSSIDDWHMIDNTVSGCEVDQYLCTLNPTDKSIDNKHRNDQYKDRAVFYDIAGYTLKGLVGLPFSKEPNIDLPMSLDYLKNNIDGKGSGLTQQTKSVLKEAIKKGRTGLFVTFPETDKQLSKADIDLYFSTIQQIKANQIINWHERTVGSIVLTDLVVIEEKLCELNPETYKEEITDQKTELFLDEFQVYNVRKWQHNKKDDTWFIVSESVPKQANGQPFSEIPFVFIGSDYNSSKVNKPPLINLCKQNIAHYRNSADYEDSVFYCGQAQPWMSGFSHEHASMMEENKSYVGSRNLLGVPSGERFGFESAPPNPLVRQAMLDKVDIMIGLGARFIKENGQIKTATEAASDSKIQHSQLVSIVNNMNDGYMKALRFVAMFMGVKEAIDYSVSTDFINPTASAQDIQAMVAGFIQGAIPQSDYFRWLKQRDLVAPDKQLEDFNDELNPVGTLELDEDE